MYDLCFCNICVMCYCDSVSDHLGPSALLNHLFIDILYCPVYPIYVSFVDTVNIHSVKKTIINTQYHMLAFRSGTCQPYVNTSFAVNSAGIAEWKPATSSGSRHTALCVCPQLPLLIQQSRETG